MPLFTELPRREILGHQSAPSKLYLLLLLTHHQNWAVGMPNNRIRNASQKGPSYPILSPALHNHNTGVQLLTKVHEQKAIEELFNSSPRTTAPPNGNASPYAELAVYTRNSDTVSGVS
jgi:hypothetical protein